MDEELLELKDLLELLRLNLVNLLTKTLFNELNLKQIQKHIIQCQRIFLKQILKYGKRKYLNNL